MECIEKETIRVPSKSGMREGWKPLWSTRGEDMPLSSGFIFVVVTDSPDYSSGLKPPQRGYYVDAYALLRCFTI